VTIVHRSTPLVFLLIAFFILMGCASSQQSSYTVDSKGILSITCAPVTTTETQLFSNSTYTETRIVMHTRDGDMVTYLAAPKHPKAVIVYVPGAGEKKSGHEERMVRYAAAGYAFLFVDTRGNGGETPGVPFGPQLIQQDYTRFEKGEWPQYYQSVCDLVAARQLMTAKFSVPVYAMGSSNGGRYAAVAAGVDPEFAGYIGISTSDWGVKDAFLQQGYSGDPIRFASSIEPSTYLPIISPRPIWIFHAKADLIIPYENGEQFFAEATEPKEFIAFSGDHGINPDVDERILVQWAQIYGTQA